MSFSDEDLKRLKEAMKGPGNILSDGHYNENCSCCGLSAQLPALLHRLEFAERVIAASFDPSGTSYIGYDDWHEDLAALRQAAGKGE